MRTFSRSRANTKLGIKASNIMPELSRFLGIVIYMYFREHAPAHFHAEYGDYEITVEIESGLVTGRFPRRALNFVLEWYALHKDDLFYAEKIINVQGATE